MRCINLGWTKYVTVTDGLFVKCAVCPVCCEWQMQVLILVPVLYKRRATIGELQLFMSFFSM